MSDFCALAFKKDYLYALLFTVENGKIRHNYNCV